MRLPTAKYEEHMKKFFYRLGMSIGKRPWTYILGLLLFTALSTIGFIRFHQINNARITFTASDSLSHGEGRVFSQFMRQNGSLHMIEVMIDARDNGSLLRDEHREQLSEMIKELTTKVTVTDLHGRQIGFFDICEPYCVKNDALLAMLKLYGGNFSRFELTYPNMEIMGQRVFIAGNIYHVELEENSTTVKAFRTAMLHFFLVHENVNMLYKWEDAILPVLHSDRYPLLRAGAASDNIVAKEVRDMGTKTAPLLLIALVVLGVFLVISSFKRRRRESKPTEAILGALIPVLAGITTIGLVSASGLAFQSIVVSTLFMLLAIGIDDVFIMLAAWHRTDKLKDVQTRIAETVQESGCSMTVTSITNLISFGNGVLSTTPVLQTFAIYSTAASVVCFAYQLVLFPAILALTAHKEYKSADEDSSCHCLPEEMVLVAKIGKKRDAAFRWLACVVETWYARILTFMFLAVFWTASVYGVLHVDTDLSVQKLALPDSQIVPFKNAYDIALKDMQTYAVIVQTPGDLRDPSRLDKLKDMVDAYEHSAYAYGPESTFFWLRSYEEFLMFYEGDSDDPAAFTYSDLPEFLRTEENSYYRAMLRLNESACRANQPGCIEQFMFTTAFTTVVRYNEMYPLVAEWRGIASNFSEFSASAYSERSDFADQSVSLEPVIWETLWSEVLCMGLSFIIFIPDLVSIAAALFSLVSVNLGVFGFLSLWGVGVDPFSMASLLMSIGFSVDISAHISYHYYEVKAPTPREKMADALVNVGWPTMQGSIATVVCMTPILIKPAYLGMVFLKTVALVTCFGLLHGLVILPVLLSFFTDLFRRGHVKVHQAKDSSPSESESSSVVSIPPHRITIRSITAPKGEV